MKATLYFIFILFTFVILVFVPNSFAQDTSPEYVVRMIYFLPNDRQPKPDIDKILDARIKEAQRFFADQLEAHGFDRKMFRIETDDAGNAIIHHVNGRHDDAYYQNPSIGGSHRVVDEIAEQFDMSKNIYFVTLESSSIFLDGSQVTGWASGDDVSGVALVTAFEEVPTIHELGHAFGLLHDNRSHFKANRIYTSNFHELMTSSFCAAEWLYAHRYFNVNPGEVNDNTDIQFHPPELVESPTKIRLQFTLTDPDGLHQVQLLHPQRFIPGPYSHLATSEDEATLAACQRLDDKRTTVEFVTRDLVVVNKILLHIMDVQGNITTRLFDLDIAHLLPLHEIISIPDENLAAAIREELGLASGDPITGLDMLRLSKLVTVGRQITALTGLEHAIYLRELNLLGNQIEDVTLLSQLTYLTDLSIGFNKVRDITPLKALKHLKNLSLGTNSISDITILTSLVSLEVLAIGSNPISDIRPVWELTQLRYLSLRFLEIRDLSPLAKFTNVRQLQLDDHQISDITPLAGLTGLTALYLNNNQISDVSPLTGLINLTQLHLKENPIKDREPLFTLLEKNPDVKIYLKWDAEPLPVTLSHFRAEHTDADVLLKWVTESEVDNAGFYIYRSETKDGEFKVVTPTIIQGAGTTSERNEYTWTDTTAKPNTVYYYQIEDISHAGVRKQLATVRMRGFVSASGKLTTKWAGLKVQD